MPSSPCPKPPSQILSMSSQPVETAFLVLISNLSSIFFFIHWIELSFPTVTKSSPWTSVLSPFSRRAEKLAAVRFLSHAPGEAPGVFLEAAFVVPVSAQEQCARARPEGPRT